MPVDVIVGGQGGDEGKGKIAAYKAIKGNYDIVLRVSKPQAGHSLHYKGKRVGLATIPCGFLNENSRILIGRGAFISVSRLEQEIKASEINPERLGIDEYATIVTDEHVREERENKRLMGKIGSVGTGAGPATRDKVMRKKDLLFAKDIPELQKYLTDTVDEIHKKLSKNGKVLLEGDQGFKLSLIHGEYPYVTSCDTTASALLSKAGIGPKDVKNVYIIFKPYVTRVAPGPLEKEIFDEETLKWAHTEGGESGTVSKRLRRLGEFEWDKAWRAILMNSATRIVITHMDYFGEVKEEKLPEKAQDFLNQVRQRFTSKYPYPRLTLISYGPNVNDVKELDFYP